MLQEGQEKSYKNGLLCGKFVDKIYGFHVNDSSAVEMF
jgi:hypothetical protein